MKRGHGFGLLGLGRKSFFFFFFFKKMLMSPSLHGMITALYFLCLLSEKSPCLFSLPLAFRVFIFCTGSRVIETSL